MATINLEMYVSLVCLLASHVGLKLGAIVVDMTQKEEESLNQVACVMKNIQILELIVVHVQHLAELV